jgi:hypothetical protein
VVRIRDDIEQLRLGAVVSGDVDPATIAAPDVVVEAAGEVVAVGIIPAAARARPTR